MKAETKEEIVPYEPGKKRGNVYIPKYNEAEMEAIRRKEAVAEAVRLDDDEEAALGDANTNDLMSLAEILDSNPQEFIMDAYADDLKYFEADTENKTNFLSLSKRLKTMTKSSRNST